jgi:exodeoxyribonuclease VII large subunit
MAQSITLSELTYEIAGAIEDRMGGHSYWITAEVCDVKKYASTRRCYLKFIERENNNTVAEMRGVFWSNSYSQIENFEKKTNQVFADGIKITCNVVVRFHPKYGLNVDVFQIDVAFTLGTQELERQQTLERLVALNPEIIRFIDGRYRTFNNTMPLPLVIQKIALVTAPNSDGQRDFKQELEKNKYGYAISVTEFLTQIQGDNAHKLIAEQLILVAQQQEKFDVAAIVRGGGSQTDFRPFEDYDLARLVAGFPIPIFTGVGHDRNTSIVDLMAREQKTPTKVAALIIDHNFEFENKIIALKDYFFERIARLLKSAKDDLQSIKRLVKMASPDAVLKKGFAMITVNGKIITDPAAINENAEIQTLLRNEIITSTVTKKTKNEQSPEL